MSAHSLKNAVRSLSDRVVAYFYVPQHVGDYVPHASWFQSTESLAKVDNYASSGRHARGVSVAEIFSRMLTEESCHGALAAR